MKIIIVGGGAMGCLFAGFLSRRPENEIFLIEKNSKVVNSIKKKGIKISGETKLTIPPERIKIRSTVRDLPFADLIIFLVKTYDTPAAARKITSLISENTIILSLQNGLGNVEAIKAAIKKRSVLVFAGTTSHASMVIGYGRIRHTGSGETVIGGRREQTKKIKEIFEKSGIKTLLKEDTDAVLWSKLLINSSLNPVGAIFNLKNGEILKNKPAREMMLEAAREIWDLCRLRKTKLLYKDPLKKIVNICKMTSENKNSMLKDIMEGRKTEIESINGAVVSEARKFRKKVPVNETLYNIVKMLDY